MRIGSCGDAPAACEVYCSPHRPLDSDHGLPVAVTSFLLHAAVYARWLGPLYYSGTIAKIDEEPVCRVIFNDGRYSVHSAPSAIIIAPLLALAFFLPPPTIKSLLAPYIKLSSYRPLH